MEKKLEEFKDIFVQECYYWQDYFGLKQWEFTCDFNPKYKKSEAQCSYDSSNKTVTIEMCGGCRPTDFYVRLAAFHEVCELLLSEVRDLLDSVEIQENKIDSAIHSVVRTLENTIFKDIYNDRFKK